MLSRKPVSQDKAAQSLPTFSGLNLFQKCRSRHHEILIASCTTASECNSAIRNIRMRYTPKAIMSLYFLNLISATLSANTAAKAPSIISRARAAANFAGYSDALDVQQTPVGSRPSKMMCGCREWPHSFPTGWQRRAKWAGDSKKQRNFVVFRQRAP